MTGNRRMESRDFRNEGVRKFLLINRGQKSGLLIHIFPSLGRRRRISEVNRIGVPLLFCFFLLYHFCLSASTADTSDLLEISSLIEKNRCQEAVKLLDNIKPSGKDKALYHLLYAKASISLGKFNQALSHLQLASSYGTQEIKEEAIFLRAELYLKMRFYPEASTIFRLFLNLFPDSEFKKEALLGLAESLRKSGQYQEALKYYEKAGDCVACLYGKANTLHLMGRHKDASNLYLELLLNDNGFVKTSPETMLLIGENMSLTGKKEEAKRFLTSVKEFPYKYRAYLILGTMEMESGRFDRALNFFDQSLQSEEPAVRQRAHLLSAQVLLNLERFDEAKKRLNDLRALYPYGDNYERALLLLSKIYKRESRYKEAVLVLKPLIIKRQPLRDASETLKDLLLEAGLRNPETLYILWNDFKRIFLDTSNTSFLFQVAPLLRDSKKDFFELARWLYKSTKGTDRRKAAFLLSEFYLSTGDPEMALGVLQGVEPENDKETRLLASAFIRKRDYESGLKYLRRLTEITEEDMPLLLTLSLYKRDDSITGLLERLINKKGAPAQAYIRLADLLYERDKDKALTYYRIALSEDKKGELEEKDIEWANYRVLLISRKFNEVKTRGFGGLFSEEEAILKRLRRDF